MQALRSIVLVSTTAGLAACASKLPESPYKAYLGSDRPLAELAIVRASGTPREFVASVVAYGVGTPLVGGTSTGGRVKELRVLPGEYTFELLCTGNRSSGRPRLVLKVSAGKTYEVGCARTGANDDRVRGAVLSIEDSSFDK
jgi:hypothetical protein